jgi:predicted transcriptional regulator
MNITGKLYEIGDITAEEAIHDSKLIAKAIMELQIIGECSERDVAKYFGIPKSTLHDWRKGKCPRYVFVTLHILKTYQKLSQ